MKRSILAALAVLYAVLHPSLPAHAGEVYFFQVMIGDRLISPSTVPAPETVVIACHSRDRNAWIDETIELWERRWCDARYGANLWVRFDGGEEARVQVDPPPENPCIGSKEPAYRIDLVSGDGEMPALEAEHPYCS